MAEKPSWASSYTHGTPVWLHIPAADVSQAKTFYSSLLHFTFRHTDDTEDPGIAHFEYPNSQLKAMVIGGAIMKTRDHETIVSDTYKKGEGKIVPTMYWFVDDLGDVLGKVEGLGGKVLVGRTAQGDSAEHAVLQDTEGNALGVYGLVKT